MKKDSGLKDLNQYMQAFLGNKRSDFYKLIRKNKKIYIIYKCLKSKNKNELYKLLYSYYEHDSDMCVTLAEHLGDKYPDKLVYYIDLNQREKDFGFFALMRHTLEYLNFAKLLGFIPVVNWGTEVSYYDSDMDDTTLNVFEYYFNPVTEISCQEEKEIRNIIYSHIGHGNFFMEHAGHKNGYLINEQELQCLGQLYKQYIHLNEKTKKFLTKEVKKLINKKTTLGVHVRGTDFALGYKVHPIMITAREYLEETKKVFSSGKYEQIFLATDDLKALTLFKNEFGNKLVYFKDTIRTDLIVSSKSIKVDRHLHHYRLGLEVLRDVYTLVFCNSFIAGLSQVSFAVRYINYSYGRKFDELIILDNGINE